MGYFLLALSALFPVLVATGLFAANKYTKFQNIPFWWKQVIFGVIFGGLAIAATHLGIKINGVTMNARDASPVIAALIFGWPAGLIAGVIGGVERFFAAYYGAGTLTQIACSFSTLFAGCFASLLRRYLFDNKIPHWYYHLSTGIVVEIFHMLMVFLTHMNEIDYVFVNVVEVCSIPMIIAVGCSCLCAGICVNLFNFKIKNAKDAKEKRLEKSSISNSIQKWLFFTVALGFIATAFFSYSIQNSSALTEADNLLEINIKDVQNDIEDTNDNEILNAAYKAKEKCDDSTDEDYAWNKADNVKYATGETDPVKGGYQADDIFNILAHKLAEKAGVDEINLVSADGLIYGTTVPSYYAFDMSTGGQQSQSKDFNDALTSGEHQSYVQPCITNSSGVIMKYAGWTLTEGGYIQAGYTEASFNEAIADTVQWLTVNRHIGEEGYLLIADSGLNVVGDSTGHDGMNLLTDHIIKEDITKKTSFSMFLSTFDGAKTYLQYGESESYYILACIPYSQVTTARDMFVYVTVFSEAIVFSFLFIVVYYLIKVIVVKNIHKINRDLDKISSGNLNTVIDVRDNQEFASLSDDINHTVGTLKEYIAEASARIDKELELAKAIQHGSLPTTFPMYGDTLIYASMETAKEVGGDFYDFYFLDHNHLVILMADVSGKGIGAAMFMMRGKSVIKSLMERGCSVEEAFTQANNSLCEGNDAALFITAWMGLLDIQTHELTFVNAGHCQPLVKHGPHDFAYLKIKPGFVLAGVAGFPYHSETIILDPGDKLYLYTDGVTEATNSRNELYGEERLLQNINEHQSETPKQICHAISDSVRTFDGEAPQFDDITMLLLEFRGHLTSGSLEVTSRKDDLEKIDAFLENKLAGMPPKTISDVLVVTDEIFANISNYAYDGAGKVTVEVNWNDHFLELRFIDWGKPFNPLESQEPDINASLEDRPIGGLGLFIVKKMTNGQFYEYKEGANVLTVWKTVNPKESK